MSFSKKVKYSSADSAPSVEVAFLAAGEANDGSWASNLDNSEARSVGRVGALGEAGAL